MEVGILIVFDGEQIPRLPVQGTATAVGPQAQQNGGGQSRFDRLDLRRKAIDINVLLGLMRARDRALPNSNPLPPRDGRRETSAPRSLPRPETREQGRPAETSAGILSTR